jgi:hypothetical protein
MVPLWHPQGVFSCLAPIFHKDEKGELSTLKSGKYTCLENVLTEMSANTRLIMGNPQMKKEHLCGLLILGDLGRCI